MKMDDMTAEEVRRLFDYDPVAGKLIWRHRPEKQKNWNSRFVGKVAGTQNSAKGYSRLVMGNRICGIHRLIWLHQYGVWPTYQIDHVNGIRNDNRLENLRDVSPLANGRNQRRHSDNKSGVTGVAPMYGKWRAYINLNRKQKHLGLFDTKEEAIAARLAANEVHGFHPNHGNDI